MHCGMSDRTAADRREGGMDGLMRFHGLSECTKYVRLNMTSTKSMGGWMDGFKFYTDR